MKPGEVAATAGTSGVIYGVADTLVYDKQSRINSFAHVNHTNDHTRIGVLLCINGCGILNKSIRLLTGSALSYASINQEAAGIQAGSNGLTILPFGNGAERMLNNQCPGAQVHGWDFNIHGNAHFYRAVQEGIAFAFRYGFDIMRENGMQPGVIRAGKANMFLSEVFTQTLVDILGIQVELYDADGSVGAALGAGVGAGFFGEDDLGRGLTLHSTITPNSTNAYEPIYQGWLELLKQSL
jgi:xylulokinase